MKATEDFCIELNAQYANLKRQLSENDDPAERLNILEQMSALSSLMAKQQRNVVSMAPKRNSRSENKPA